jgi:predicted nucleotidyltransferase component of viral defense system
VITQADIRETANHWKLEDHIIEKDYVLGWLLWGIAKHPVLSKAWVLKGGMALKKCYADTHRHSQDLDFTVLPDGPWQPEELHSIFNEILKQVSQKSGIDFTIREPKFEIRPHRESCEGRIYYIGPRENPSPTAAKLDITHAEDLMRPPVLRSISHPYPDDFPADVQIYCYSFEELFAEKIRALLERARPGDLYDIIYLFRRSDLNAEPELIHEVLEYKCDFKGIPVPQSTDLCTPERREEIKSRWEPMLGRAVGLLPSLDDYWDELPNFFAWLYGEEYEVPLLPIAKEDAWSPAPIVWQRGQNERLEPIRFAAVNRLLINLGYGSGYRLVEPYSLRITRAGNVLFYALKAQARQIRSYRLDRIQSVEVTRHPFTPVFRIEFTPEGRIPVPYTNRHRRFTSSRSKKRYVIECAVCGKRFYREKYSTGIKPHKHRDSNFRCSGRYGYLV